MGSESDVFLVDLNGDGTFLPPTEEAMEIAVYSGEVYYLTNLVQLPDRNFYRVKVAEDFSRFWLECDLSPKGKVRAACKELILAWVDRTRSRYVGTGATKRVTFAHRQLPSPLANGCGKG